MSQRPNILFVLIDDLGWSDLSCFGSTFYETPNLDRLAAEGVRFTNAYAAAPVCSPTRASILSGKYPARLGVTNYIGGRPARGRLLDAPYIDHLPLDEVSLASALKSHGYVTWHVGKWHLGTRPYYPEHHGFDVNIGGCNWGHPKNGYYSPYGIETLADGLAGEYLTDRLTDEAISLIRHRHVQKDQRPFFLYLSHYAVHTPIQALEPLVDKYIAKARKMGLDTVNALQEGGFFPVHHKKGYRIIRRTIQSDVHYAAMVENLDANIGRVLQTLEAVGDLGDTIIIFTSDNGGLATAEGSPTCNAPLAEGKGWMYEGGLREPLIVKWPGVTRAGTRCDVPVTSPDFYPTLLDMAQLPLREDQHVDGVSWAPLLRGASGLARDAIYWHFPHYGNQGSTPGAAVRMGSYKLIEFYEEGRLELYDLREDLGEQNNLASRFPDITVKLHQRLEAWRKAVAAQLPAEPPDD